MAEQTLTVFPGDTVTIYVSGGQTPEPDSQPAPDAAAAADASAVAPAAPDAPAGDAPAGVDGGGDVLSVGAADPTPEGEPETAPEAAPEG